MINFIINLLAFIVAISFLVAFHEWGHYCVARWMNVKVLRFSIGFGRILWSKTLKSGLEICLSAIPLGGYVKMLDEREGPVPDHELHLSFNRQNVWKRILIVAAGPLTNFLLAIVLFIVVLMSGVSGVAPIVKEVKPDSAASHAHIQIRDEFIAIGDTPVNTLMEVSRAFAHYLNEPSVQATLLHEGTPYTVTLPLPSLEEKEQSALESMGLTMGLPGVLGEIDPNSPAQKAGLKKNDMIIEIDNLINPDWMELVTYISAHPDQNVPVTILRDGQTEHLTVVPQKNPQGRGVLGVHIHDSFIRIEKYPASIAIQKAVTQTADYAWLTLKMIGLMVTGQASLEHLSGPVSIAQVAGATAKVGLTYYLDFLAIISISLGVLNLLPVPVLDGGHLLYYLIEVVRRKPLTEATQMMGLRLGMIILLSLMIVAFYNDILRLV